MFKQQKSKNAFLQKKNLEKAKAADQFKQKTSVLKLQKNLRAHLIRKALLQKVENQTSVKLHLLMKGSLAQFTREEIQGFASSMKDEPQAAQLYYLQQLVIRNIFAPNCQSACLHIINEQYHYDLRQVIFRRSEFLRIVSRLFEEMKVNQLTHFCSDLMEQRHILIMIQGSILLKAVLHQFRKNSMEIQNGTFSKQSISAILSSLFRRSFTIQQANLEELSQLIVFYGEIVQKLQNQEVQSTLCYLLDQFLRIGINRHEEVVAGLIKENQTIIALVEDQEMMEEVEKRMRQNEPLEDFTNEFLGYIKKITNSQVIVKCFEGGRFKQLNAALLKIVNQLSVLFEDRKLIFIRSIISSDSLLRSLSQSKDSMFREGLKMRLLPMDDPQFKDFNIFAKNEWVSIIKSCVEIADIKIQKMVEIAQNQSKQKFLPFKKRNRDELEFKTIVDLLGNLYKKVYRTGKFSPEVFVDQGLSNLLSNFLFGKGAKRIELFLKHFPYLFSFESRMAKFKDFIKADKKNYDRTLFLQEEIDEDLIIEVRRGNEFMDAFQGCMARDLRMKYKIIFFNEQGLQEEGVDGGGIIKEFINRVLKSAFSSAYSLFMETPLNEILPNPYSMSVAEYELVGKLIGKAVYQGINIEQKFAQPFLNLLIGRQNTFQDLQYIDPAIYSSLINLKNTTQDISQLQQTFVIYDSLPNGTNKYINLLCPSKPPNQKHVYVTNENKIDFIMSYADFKCNKQIEEKTRLFRKGFLQVMKPEWLTMFSNQELNSIISGANPDFNVEEMRAFTVYKDYHEKDETIAHFWQVVKEMSCEEKSHLLLFITSCSRPPTLGFQAMKPKLCINRDNDANHLPTANTCMNVLRLPNYKNKAVLKKKLLYAIFAKAGFQFA